MFLYKLVLLQGVSKRHTRVVLLAIKTDEMTFVGFGETGSAFAASIDRTGMGVV